MFFFAKRLDLPGKLWVYRELKRDIRMTVERKRAEEMAVLAELAEDIVMGEVGTGNTESVERTVEVTFESEGNPKSMFKVTFMEPNGEAKVKAAKTKKGSEASANTKLRRAHGKDCICGTSLCYGKDVPVYDSLI